MFVSIAVNSILTLFANGNFQREAETFRNQ